MQRTTYYHVCAVHSGLSNRSERTVGVDEHEQNRDRQKVGFSLSQETITILTVGVALAGLMFVNQGHLHAEARAEREEMRVCAKQRARKIAPVVHHHVVVRQRVQMGQRGLSFVAMGDQVEVHRDAKRR